MAESTRCPYRCVAFDAVGTLIEARPSVGAVYCDAARRFGSSRSEDEVRRRLRTVFHQRIENDATDEVSEKEFWRKTVEDVIGPVDDPAVCFDDLYAYFGRPDAWTLTPTAAETIDAFASQGVLVAVASNFDERLNQVIDGIPSLRNIGLRVISSEVGWRKPNVRFFEALVRMSGAAPDELLMVGDDLNIDVLPAIQFGIDALLVGDANAAAAIPPSVSRISILSETLAFCGLKNGE